MKTQLVLISDMEGASGIFENDVNLLLNGDPLWRTKGRQRMTSDVLAVCHAAKEFGSDEIMYYDAHCAGSPEYNVLLERLPANVKLFDTPNRRFDWRRIRGQAQSEPFGLITVGQHARNGTEHAYFPHTIQSPPIKSLWLNGMHIAEMGMAVLNFQGVRFLANIGCEASRQEAMELSPSVKQISVKDKAKGWEPGSEETYPIIKTGVLAALKDGQRSKGVVAAKPYNFRLELCKYFYFEQPPSIPWKGSFGRREATWQAPNVEIGFEIFNYVRSNIRIAEQDRQRLKNERRSGEYDATE